MTAPGLTLRERTLAIASLVLAVAIASSAAAAGQAAGTQTSVEAADARLLGDGATVGHVQECGGQAPLVPVCTTGVHVRQGNTFALGVEAQNYVGVLENRIEWAFGSIVFRCHVDGTEIDCTSHEDGFPAAGTPVLHECRSLDPGSERPGGSGTWSCSFVD